MIKWFPIKKRKGNAILYGQDLGTPTPAINVIVKQEEKLPKPKFNITQVKGNDVQKL